jgi:hypothetical protein
MTAPPTLAELVAEYRAAERDLTVPRPNYLAGLVNIANQIVETLEDTLTLAMRAPAGDPVGHIPAPFTADEADAISRAADVRWRQHLESKVLRALFADDLATDLEGVDIGEAPPAMRDRAREIVVALGALGILP